MNRLRGANLFLIGVFFLAGTFAILIASHEAYHYFSLSDSGKAKGVCFGNCDIGGYQNQSHAVGAVFWDWDSSSSKTDFNKEERNAWIFSFVLTFGLLGLLLNNFLFKRKYL